MRWYGWSLPTRPSAPSACRRTCVTIRLRARVWRTVRNGVRVGGQGEAELMAGLQNYADKQIEQVLLLCVTGSTVCVPSDDLLSDIREKFDD